MNIQYASDLHLEFPENQQWLNAHPLKPAGDVLVLAGDVVLFRLLESHNDFFDYISDNFQRCFWVPGNHEYYGSDLALRSGVLNEKIRENVFLVNQVAIDYNQVHFVFCTLWTKIRPLNERSIQKGMADFKVIQYMGNPLMPSHYNEQHAACRKFLEKELSNVPTNTVVVTHHVPTLLNYPEEYKGSVLNEAFAVELFDLIEPSGVRYWIFGHHHQPVPNFKIGETIMTTNQLGYIQYEEHNHFRTDIALDLT